MEEERKSAWLPSETKLRWLVGGATGPTNVLYSFE